MRYFFEAIIPVMIVVGAGGLSLRALRRGVDRRKRRTARWQVFTTHVAGQFGVYVWKYGEEPRLLAPLDFQDPDFDAKLLDAQARAESIAATMNSSLDLH